MTPRFLKFILNAYPPYLGAGVRVTHIAPDWSRLDVRMRLRFYNRNYMGTHFGGSLYSMVDPHFALLLINKLGSEYAVWDQGATIHFRTPGKSAVFASFRLPEARVDQIRTDAASGEPIRPEFAVQVVDENGGVVAEVEKVLYVRKKSR